MKQGPLFIAWLGSVFLFAGTLASAQQPTERGGALELLRHGHEVGNGGGGVWINGRILFLDFMEAGILTQPTFFSSQLELAGFSPNPLRIRLLSENIILNAPHETLDRKLRQIASQDKALGALLFKYLAFRLVFFKDTRLRLTEDNAIAIKNHPVLKAYRPGQLALRVGDKIHINMDIWPDLPPDHKIGLLIHEALYFHLHNNSFLPANEKSKQARFLTACLFADKRDLIYSDCPAHPWVFSDGGLVSHIPY